MPTLLELDDGDRAALLLYREQIHAATDALTGLPVVAVFAAIARSGMTNSDIDDLMDLLNMISHSYWVGARDEGEGVAAVMRELGEASN